jgi:hypothetical protein
VGVSRIGNHTFDRNVHDLLCRLSPTFKEGYALAPHRVHTENAIYYIARTSKDAESIDNNPQIPHLKDTIVKFKNYLKHNANRNRQKLPEIGIFPCVLCRGWGGIPISVPGAQRAHYIVVEVNFTTEKIIAHDSEGAIKWWLYPQKLTKIAAETGLNYVSTDYHTYATQDSLFNWDFNSCGWRALMAIAYLLTGQPEMIGQININLQDFPRTSQAFFDRYINDILKKSRYKNIRVDEIVFQDLNESEFHFIENSGEESEIDSDFQQLRVSPDEAGAEEEDEEYSEHEVDLSHAYTFKQDKLKEEKAPNITESVFSFFTQITQATTTLINKEPANVQRSIKAK